jgi:hypothetical protein
MLCMRISISVCHISMLLASFCKIVAVYLVIVKEYIGFVHSVRSIFMRH